MSGKGLGFKSFNELRIGMIVDAQDVWGKWYVGIVVDRKYDFENSET